MPLPLVWLGAAVTAAYTGNKIAKSLSRDEGNIAVFPGERSMLPVVPLNGAILCCGIYNVLIHTGIWWEGKIVELAGTGLIRAVSVERFLADRSGNTTYIACNASAQAIADEQWALRAIDRLFTYSPYDVINNNCHRFVAQCMLTAPPPVTRFGQLNRLLSSHHCGQTYWHPADIREFDI
ncbi:hypothetical protein [Aestuariibacter sp. A3R04]|uniref:hypothetical protein n=1 Tax=Aestuariibacter sp. A3R04 TaxID=2841571 RepID=UPI001C09894B|nr:hypothetical protein [Aestuariibacter sp. A3R04]MBU3022737.1 hypothetical protein [Aestuariibacter sp. A3R04]